MSTLDVIVATIGRAHGLRGEVALTLPTSRRSACAPVPSSPSASPGASAP